MPVVAGRLVILRHIHNIGAKSPTQTAQSRRFYLTQCLPIAFTLNDVGQNLFTFGKIFEKP